MRGREGRLALVTGGAGFIGSHLVDGLARAGWRVRVLDDFSSGFEENLARARERIELLRADLRDDAALDQAVSGAEVVFHQAAIPSVPRSVAEPVRTDAVNLGGTVKLLDSARRAGVRRVVFAASAAAYGESEVLPKTETMPAEPVSPYALQKYASELYCQLFTRFHGLETVALRYFNVYGPRQNPDSPYASVIPLFIRACLKSESARIFGDGEQTRDFVFVQDVVRANLLAAEAAPAVGKTINVAQGRRTRLLELLEVIQEITGCRAAPIHEAPRPGDVRHSEADVQRARELLGFQPAVSLREGLGRTVESFRDSREGVSIQ